MSDAARNDVTITFGQWEDKTSTWTDLGATVPPTSPANAVQITMRRAAGTVYGPVANFFAGIFGVSSTEMTVSGRAYMGYAALVYKGTVPVPVALPNTVLQTASSGNSGWLAGLFGPGEVMAAKIKMHVFKDTGGKYVDSDVTTASSLDPSQAYLFTVGSGDAVPGTILDILEKIYTPGKTGSILFVDKLALGQQIYARSEFKYGANYIGLIFQRLQKAYYYKTTGNANIAPAAGTPWRVTFAIYSTKPNPLVTQRLREGFMPLARLLIPFWPSEAYACYTMPGPNIYVNGFVNADIVSVTYNGSCSDCSYTFPATINGVTYTNKKECMSRYDSSCWNGNTMTIKNVTDASTILPYSAKTNKNTAGESGGLSNRDMQPAAPSDVGAFASIPKLIPR